MIRDDYAGLGGWSEGLAMLGLADIGIEWDAAACATRTAAGHATIRADLTGYQPGTPAGGWWGFLASPPCQTFSAAGSGAGWAVLPELVAAVDGEDWSAIDRHDDRTRHVLIAARNALTLGAEWVALEQVPPVLPVWEAVARRLHSRGYRAWCGVLVATDFGVPQTRRRAILIASRARAVSAPEPTHAERPAVTLFGPALPRWVSMADALGWDGTVEHQRGAGMAERHGGSLTPRSTDRPAPTLTAGARRRMLVDRRTNSRCPDGTVVPSPLVSVARPDPTLTGNAHLWRLRHSFGESSPESWTDHRVPVDRPAPTVETKAQGWVWERPATTVCADPRLAAPGHSDRAGGEPQFGPDSGRLTIQEALLLQSFPAGHPVQGSMTAQFRQVGNAVPPLLAAHVIAAATGLTDRLHHRLGAAS